MKRMLTIGILLLCLLAACNSKKQVPEPVEGPSKELSAIDSLMWRQPDSALAVLMDYLDDGGRDGVHTVSTNVTFDNHYANLLLAELLYKNDYAQTNRPELLEAVGYFDSLVAADTRGGTDTRGVSLQGPRRRDARRTSAQNTAFLTARAHYINGVGYYEHDSVVEACKEYLKALGVMEENFEEKELVEKKAKFMALTYTHLTDLFSDLYLHEIAICFGKLSLAYYQKYDAEAGHIAWMLNNIGSHYDIMSNYDSAYYYYSQGIAVLSDTNSLIYRGIETHLAFLSYKMGVSPSFLTNQLHGLLVDAKSNQEYASRCLTIGEIYYHERQFDSAWYYLNIAYNQTINVPTKKQAAEWLVEIGEAHGKNKEASEFAMFLVLLQT
ncbi:MAG: hypothetical protein IKX35_09320 [Bacteroidales bacterium]|nr:hypothetical protein [Bacteroidales bacterium]